MTEKKTKQFHWKMSKNQQETFTKEDTRMHNHMRMPGTVTYRGLYSGKAETYVHQNLK